VAASNKMPDRSSGLHRSSFCPAHELSGAAGFAGDVKAHFAMVARELNVPRDTRE